MNNVTALKLAPKASKQAKPRSRKAHRQIRQQAAAAAIVGFVAIALTGLSLAHLAKGIAIVTGADTIEAGAMAVGIDCGFIALELAQLSVTDKLRKQIARWAVPAIAGTLSGSAALNALCFAAQAEGYVMQAGAILMGVAVPAMVYAMTRVSAMLAADAYSKS